MIIVNHINSTLVRRGWLPYILVVGFYSLLRLPEILVVSNSYGLLFPLEALYITRVLFDGLAVRPDIAAAYVSPSNVSLIYPPGLYFISALSGKVSGIYWTLFAFQLAVGPLLYRLVAKVVPRVGALMAALLATFYLTKTNWFFPDFLIQPLMLSGILVLLSHRFRRGGIFHLIMLGQIAGLVIVFKHNIGVFFAILCGTWLFLDSFRPIANSQLRQGMTAAGILLVGFFSFIPIFGARLIFFDEWIFYLLPYTIFWILFVVFLRQGFLAFDPPRFLRRAVIFSVSALLLPGLIFFALGRTIGYERYWHSLFGMGLKFLPLWDYGILYIMTSSLKWVGAGNIYNSLVEAGLFLSPLAVNLFAVLCVGGSVVSGQWSVQRKLALFRIAGLGVMGILMFFPLEDIHVLLPKISLFVFVVAYFLRRFLSRMMPPIGYALALMLLPALVFGGLWAVRALKMETEAGSPTLNRKIGVPMKKEIALELDHQVEVIRRSVQGQPYYIVSSSAMDLGGLATLEDNILPQYYMDMRPGILDRDEKLVEAIKVDLVKRPYVVIQAGYYARKNETEMGPAFRELISFIDERYVLIDSDSLSDESIGSAFSHFLVMKRR